VENKEEMKKVQNTIFIY